MTETVTELARGILEAAVTRIDTHGWINSGYTGPEKPQRCLVNTVIEISRAVQGNMFFSKENRDLRPGVERKIWHELAAAVDPQEPCNLSPEHWSDWPGPRVAHWNDYHCTGEAQAREVLVTALKNIISKTPCEAAPVPVGS